MGIVKTIPGRRGRITEPETEMKYTKPTKWAMPVPPHLRKPRCPFCGRVMKETEDCLVCEVDMIVLEPR